VLVAFAILALGLTVLVRSFGLGFQGSRTADQRTAAVRMAQSKLAQLGIADPIQSGRQSGTFENGYRWILEMAPLSASSPQGDVALKPYTVTVTITVPGLRSARADSVSLTTIKLGPP
jgi:general secretion pathway protein I